MLVSFAAVCTQRRVAQAWGTGGLQPLELRAVLFALHRTPVTGKPAQQFMQLLADKVKALPLPDAELAALEAPRRAASGAPSAAAQVRDAQPPRGQTYQL